MVIAWRRVAPSILAHSSSSFGMVLKYPISSQAENGIKKVGYVRIRAHGESNRCSSATTEARGMNNNVGGTR